MLQSGSLFEGFLLSISEKILNAQSSYGYQTRHYAHAGQLQGSSKIIEILNSPLVDGILIVLIVVAFISFFLRAYTYMVASGVGSITLIAARYLVENLESSYELLILLCTATFFVVLISRIARGASSKSSDDDAFTPSTQKKRPTSSKQNHPGYTTTGYSVSSNGNDVGANASLDRSWR